MPTSTSVKFLSLFVYFSAIWGDILISPQPCLKKGIFTSTDILQIADVFHWVVSFLFLPCFKAVVQLFLLHETCEMFHHIVLLYQNKATLFSWLLSCHRFFWHLCWLLTSFSTYHKHLTDLVNNSWFKELGMGFEPIRNGQRFLIKFNNNWEYYKLGSEDKGNCEVKADNLTF